MEHTLLDGARWIAGAPFCYEPESAFFGEIYRNHVVMGSFELESVPARAELELAVLGYARVRINGKRADGSELLGWWTNFTKKVYAHKVDVAGLLHEGENEIQIELGNGFFNPSPLRLFGKYNLRERLTEVGTPRVAARLVDGEGKVLVATDASWSVREGDLLFNNVYLGEVFDLRGGAPAAGPCPVTVYDDTRSVELTPVAPCVRAGSIAPVRIFEHEGATVVDFGEVVAGFLRMRVAAHAGARIELLYSETWRDGGPYTGTAVAGYAGMETPRGVCPGGPDAPEPAEQHDSVLCHEGVNEFENRFCWHSFRYVSVTGASAADIVEAVATYVHTDLAQVGKLELGCERFERLHEAAIRTKLNNNHGLFEDCARERFGYGGDMVALAASQTFSFNVAGLIDKTLADFARDQTERGGLPETAPFMGIGSNGPAYGEGPLIWQIAYPYLALVADRVCGRRDLLEREWAGIERFGDYLLGFDAAELAPHCLGDHGSLIAQGFSSGSPDKEFVGWCAILWALGLVCEAGERLGCDVERFAAAAAELRPRIIDRFKHENGSFGDGTQTSWAFAAELGLGDQSELVGALVRAIKAEGGVLTTGIFGTSFAFRLLAEYGYSELLERWLLREENPSLLGMLADGNGALIEMFDDPLASCDHAMFSSYDQWFYEGLGGLLVARDAQGCDKLTVKPYLSHATDSFACTWKTCKGAARVEWKRADGAVTVAVEVPEGVETAIESPWGSEVLSSKTEGTRTVMVVSEEKGGC